MNNSNIYVALLYGADQPGLVAKTASWIHERQGNILHADQHLDQSEGIFFQRLEWSSSAAAEDMGRMGADFVSFASGLGMRAEIACLGRRPRVVIMVSKADHCLHDLALRWRAGEIRADLVGIVSNHEDLAEVAGRYDLPYRVVPVARDTKSEAEARQLELLNEMGADLVILARYMQVLSPLMLQRIGRPVINIHHSFLPAFAGGRPYHQAHARGVKLIGATAHYATSDLDEGPIIHQDVCRVTHRDGVADLIRMGKDLEKRVLAQAVRWHLDRRVLVFSNKTVVFE